MQTMHRSAAFKNKRTKTIVEGGLNKATKIRKSSTILVGSLELNSALADAGKKQAEASEKENGDALSPSFLLSGKHHVQVSLSQHPVGIGVLKKSTKTLRRHMSTQKGLQTTLIFQPVNTVLTVSNPVNHPPPCIGGLCHSSIKVGDVPEQQSTLKTHHDAPPKRLSAFSNTFLPKSSALNGCLKVNSLAKQQISDPKQTIQNKTDGIPLNPDVISNPIPNQVSHENRTDTSHEVQQLSSQCLSSFRLTSARDIAMCEGIQRRRSLRSHLIGGRKRYDKHVRHGTLSEHFTVDEQKSCSKRQPGVPKTTINFKNSWSIQYRSETPGSALEQTTRFITASTCASSGSHGDGDAVLHHVYAGDRTPVTLLEHSGQNTAHLDREKGLNSNVTTTSLCSYNGWVVVASDRIVLESKKVSCCLQADTAAYGHSWFVHHQQREHRFQPWQMTMQGKIEKLRLGVISMYWNAAKLYPISPATVYISINNFGRLLDKWSRTDLEQPTASRWALAAVIAFRLAFKAEERPEIVYEISNIWAIFPMFQKWDIDRSPEALNRMELHALSVLGDSLDIPLGPMFLSLYINAAGWPEDVAKDYRELGLYLLALTSFASTKDNFLRNVVPSRLAAAALVLAIKIINGDRACVRGMLNHLEKCPYPAYLAQQGGEVGVNGASVYCCCRYEFYPERLRVYTGLAFEDLISIIKGLSALLRSKPPETCILTNFFPLWANNDWQ